MAPRLRLNGSAVSRTAFNTSLATMCKPALGALLCVLASATAARADYDDEEGGGSAVVIQDREFNLLHEFTLSAGWLPLDAFAKGYTLSGRYTLHFTDFHAWEIAGGMYAFNVDTGLTGALREKFNVQPEKLPQLQVLVDTNYVMTPLYGKFVLFNQMIVYQELSLMAGATVTRWTDGSFRPGPDVGAAIRFFIWDWMSVRVDVRHALVADGIPILDPEANVDGVLQLFAGVSFNIGGGE